MLPPELSAPEPPFPGVRRAAKQALFAVGYYRRRLSQIEFPGVAILCYHGVRADDQESAPFNELHVTTQTFERHCRLLAESCNPISLDDLRAARAGTRTLPPRPVMVTFDDGYRGVLDYALPVLERHQVPAVVFACAGPVLGGTSFWFDVLYRTSGESAVLEAKRAPYAEWKALVARIETAAPVSERHRPLTLEELRRLAASPLIEIGGHTMSHPTLALTPLDEQYREIVGCRRVLQDAIKKPIESFAYPFGRVSQDYSADTVAVVKQAAFSLAFNTAESFGTVSGDPHQIPRFVMLESVDDVELAHRLSHSWREAGTTAHLCQGYGGHA
jgi:peptidoglycan/xylan/chitin deacetylase (PgdA/CDA1 family)